MLSLQVTNLKAVMESQGFSSEGLQLRNPGKGREAHCCHPPPDGRENLELRVTWRISIFSSSSKHPSHASCAEAAPMSPKLSISALLQWIGIAKLESVDSSWVFSPSVLPITGIVIDEPMYWMYSPAYQLLGGARMGHREAAWASLATDPNLGAEYFLWTTVKFPSPALLWRVAINVAHSLQIIISSKIISTHLQI